MSSSCEGDTTLPKNRRPTPAGAACCVFEYGACPPCDETCVATYTAVAKLGAKEFCVHYGADLGCCAAQSVSGIFGSNARRRAKKLGLPLPPLRPPKPGSVAALRLLPPEELNLKQRMHLATLDRKRARQKEKRAIPQTTASSSKGAIASSSELPSGNV